VIPLFRPSCTDLEVEYVTGVLRSGWWGMGPKTAEFEERFASFAGTRHAVATNGCTQALHLACQAAGVHGGEVIMPALTFAATGLAAVHNGARAVFADIDEDTLCLDWDDAAAKITADTKAVIPVWYGGTVTSPPSPLPVPVIEDCAHAAGSTGAGTLGTACWSFAAMKNIATGDGGMITTSDGELAARLRRLRFFGISHDSWPPPGHSRYAWDVAIPEAGHKAYMNDITAAIGLAQLERLAEMNKARRAVACRYLDELAGLGWLRLPRWDEDSAWHLFPVRVPAVRRDDFIGHMLACGVFCRVHYRPLNTYQVFGQVPLPVTDRVAGELATLPLFPDMTGDEASRVIAAVRGFRW
jgi:perosamine synthetase